MCITVHYMRGVTKWRGSKRLNKVHVRRVALCTSVRDDAPVAPARLNTGDYTEDARARLATAVLRARETAGPWSQQQLADRARVSKRSIIYLEGSEPRVGRKVLEAVARALPNWTEETPRLILEGADPPPTNDGPPSAPEPAPRAPGLSDAERSLIRALRRRGWPAEDIAEALDELRRSSPLLPTVEPPSETDRGRNAIPFGQSGETGTQ